VFRRAYRPAISGCRSWMRNWPAEENIDADDIGRYQGFRKREGASPKTINLEIGNDWPDTLPGGGAPRLR